MCCPTAQPKLEETGPFGYIKRTTKYDAEFTPDGSDSVTYRSWTVFDAVSLGAFRIGYRVSETLFLQPISSAISPEKIDLKKSIYVHEFEMSLCAVLVRTVIWVHTFN